MTSPTITLPLPIRAGLSRPRRRPRPRPGVRWRLRSSRAVGPSGSREPGRLRLSRRAARRTGDATVEPADPEARFAQLYDQHWDDLRRYCQRRCASAVDADDALAETFTIAWRRIADVPSGDAARPWLFVVARNLLSEHYRRGDWMENITARLTAELMTATPVPIPGDEPSRDNLEVALQALLRINFADRELIKLVAWDRISHKEAAQILGCSVNAVAIRLSRARSRLQLTFDELLRQAEQADQSLINLKGHPDISHVQDESPSEEGQR